jgi:hypothetical protein
VGAEALGVLGRDSATPATSLRLRRARSATVVPFERTFTGEPGSMPSFFASSGESSISVPGRWNCSSGTRSTAGPEKSGR